MTDATPEPAPQNATDSVFSVKNVTLRF